MADIYSHGKQYARAIEKLKTRSDVLPKNKELLLSFLDVLESRNISTSRKLKYANNLTRVAILLAKPFDQAEKNDLERLFIQIGRDGYAPNTQRDFKVLLKRFYQWLDGSPKKQYPERVAWLDAGGGAECKHYDREELLTSLEYTKLQESADNNRDKLLIALLYQTGARVGELLSLRVNDFFQEQNGTIWGVHVRGTKTKASVRDVPIRDDATINAFLSLSASLANPQKDSLLFVARTGRPLSHGSVNMLLRRLFKKAKVGKDCNPHFFRHSRATLWANDPSITRSQLCYLMGWSQSSRMPDVYLHTGRMDVFGVFEKMKAAEQGSQERIRELAGEAFGVLLQDPDAKKAMLKSAIRQRENPAVREFLELWQGAKVHLFHLKRHAPYGTSNSSEISAESNLIKEVVKELEASGELVVAPTKKKA